MLSHLSAHLQKRSQKKKDRKQRKAAVPTIPEMYSQQHSQQQQQQQQDNHHRPPSSAGSAVSHISTSTATGTTTTTTATTPSLLSAGGGVGGPQPPPVPPKRKSSQPPTPSGLTPSSSSLSGIAKSVSTVEVPAAGGSGSGSGGGGSFSGSGGGSGGGGGGSGSGSGGGGTSVGNRTQASLSIVNRETAAGAMSRANAWQALCTKVLPLFNGQGLRGHMEDMNELVSTWLGESYSSQAINEDLNEMLTTGLLTLSAKLAAVGDEGLANRIVEVWSFFFTTVVPYLQGVFLPIRTQWRLVDADPPDVRMLTLCGFRDQILLPLSGRMVDCFPRLSTDIENGRKVNDTASRLMQMLCIASGLPGPAERQKVVTSLLFDFKQTMMGSKKEAEATNRNSMALYGSRVHASS
ncbi:hypothetical protein HDU89_005762 [Geranomyces variabilis]|nr:hypothetical protein HDU89_005762 [Geranomyces variabilis]